MKLKQKQYLLIYIASLLLLIMIGNSSLKAEQISSSEDVDINENLSSKEFYTDLDGDWDFFEKALLTPNEVKNQMRSGMGKIVFPFNL